MSRAPSNPPRAGLLVLPGWDDDGKSQYHDLRERLEPEGWACHRAYLPDASWSAPVRESVNREDGLRQVREDHHALSRALPDAPLAVLGFSYGGYMAALLSANARIDWLILRAPALYLDEDWTTPKAELDKRELDDYRHRLHAPDGNRALAACARFTGDALLVQCERDEVIPEPVYESYARALGGARSLRRHVLRGADHELSRAAWRAEYHEVATGWLSERLSRRS